MAKRPRKSGMRRAYLKKTSYTYDDSPDSALKAAIGLGRNINPVTALPARTRLRLNKNKHTPTMTKPMTERVESWHVAIKDQKNEYSCVLVNTPLRRVRMFFTGFSIQETYWFKWFDPICGTERVSITYGSKVIAMSYFTKGTITWK